MIVKLTDLGGNNIFVNQNKIIHFYKVEATISYNKKTYTEILLDSCSLQVKESCEQIYTICNK
jgi:hypothetical protein